MTCRTRSNASGATILSTLTQFSSLRSSTPFSLHPLELQWPLTYINTKTTFPSVGSADARQRYLSRRVIITLLRDLPFVFYAFLFLIFFFRRLFWFHFLPDKPFNWKHGTRCCYLRQHLFRLQQKHLTWKPLGTRLHSKTFFWMTSGSLHFIWVASTDKKNK